MISPDTVSGICLGYEASKLLSSPEQRPTPERMKTLVQSGMTEDHLRSAWDDMGNPEPDMDLTLSDLESTLPVISSVTRVLASAPDTVHTVFAARDAELLHDHFAVATDRPSVLLPASLLLWTSYGWTEGLGGQFLAQHGMGVDFASKSNRKVDLVDTGFAGTIGKLLRGRLASTHEDVEFDGGRVNTRLVCAENLSAELELPIHLPPVDEYRTILPKTTLTGILGDNKLPQHGEAFPYAVALQLMPRYHGAYQDLTRVDGEVEVVARPANEPVTNDVDGIDEAGERQLNRSIVNPLAAAIVQRRVVSSALQEGA